MISHPWSRLGILDSGFSEKGNGNRRSDFGGRTKRAAGFLLKRIPHVRNAPRIQLAASAVAIGGEAVYRAARDLKGEILSIVTSYAETGSAFVLPSAVAKAGVLAMTRSLAVEWATYGIRLNAVAPGPFPTEGAFSRLMPGRELEQQALRRVPSRRFGEHWELTNLVAYLMSDASPYQTGDLVTLDGAEALFSGQQFAGLAHLDRAAAKALMESLKPRK